MDQSNAPRRVCLRPDTPGYEADRPLQRSDAVNENATRARQAVRRKHDESSSWAEARSQRREEPPERGRPIEDVGTRSWRPQLRESTRGERTDAREPAREGHFPDASSDSEDAAPQRRHMRVENDVTGEREARQAAWEAELSAQNPYSTFPLIGFSKFPTTYDRNQLRSVRTLVPAGITRQVDLKEPVKAMKLPLVPK